MQASKQFLLEAVGLLLTVALILVGVRVFHRAENVIGRMEERQEKQLHGLEEYEILRYEGFQIDGMTAVSYIRSMVDTYGLMVTVTTPQGTFSVEKGYAYAELRNMDSKSYINPLTQFSCAVQRDENDAIVGAELVYTK